MPPRSEMQMDQLDASNLLNPEARVSALDEASLAVARRWIWALCIAVYLIVVIGGIGAGGAELMSMARAVGLTLATAVLGQFALRLLAGASLRVGPGPMANPEGKLGSLVDLASAVNVPLHQEDEARGGLIGER
jgi:hypothetical protein